MPVTYTRLGDMVFSLNYLCDQTLYLASEDALLRSMDSGQTWSMIPTSQITGYVLSVPSLAVVTTNTLFVGLGGGQPYLYSQQGLFYTADGGQTWEQLYQGGVDDVAVSPNYTQDHTVLIGIAGYHWNGGILKSTDGGHTWQPSRDGLAWGSDGETVDITFSPGYTQDHTVFSVSWGALYKSTDEGAHWTRISPAWENMPWGAVNHFVLSPWYLQDHTLWLSGWDEGNLVSTNGGNTWRSLPEPVVLLAGGAYCPPGSLCRNQLFGYTWDSNYNNYVYKSFDGGMTWHCMEEDYTPPPIVPRAFFPLIMQGSH
jgi:photosystem II stability/assembly factor-like uncharacterized protein